LVSMVRTRFFATFLTTLLTAFLTGVLTLLPAGPAAADPADRATERYPPEHKETKELIALVEDAAALVAEHGVYDACGYFRQEGSRWLDAEHYVFIIDLEGDAVCHPVRPELEGKTLLELRDPNGKPVVRNFLREIQGGDVDGWVHYQWPRPGGGTFYWKTSYVRRVEAPDGRAYVVGSGLYQMKPERFFVVEQVDDAADLLETLGEVAFETLRDKSSGYRFYDAYVFVMDEDGVQRVNAGFPEYEGQNLLDFEDPDGKVIGREMLALLDNHDSGWVDYLWPRPGDTRPIRKSTYVRKVDVDGKTMVVGAGMYLGP
jgi:signal transduction histidine kinase